MATDPSFAEFVLGQIELRGRADVRRMFGEYALYVDGKVVALICDNQVFLKPLETLREKLRKVDEAPPYPGAKPHFRIDAELERPGELTALLVEAARRLPERKPKSKSKSKSKPKPKPKPKSPARTKSASSRPQPTKPRGARRR